MKNYSYIDSPEMASVGSATRIIALIISGMYVIAYNLIFLFYTPDKNILQILGVVFSYFLLAIAFTFHRRNPAPLFALIALQITSLNLTIYGPNQDVSATSSTAIFLSVAFGITTLNKKWIPTWIALNVIHLTYLVTKIGIPTNFFGIELPVRTFSVIQVTVVAVWFYFSWFRQLEFVKARDALNRRLADSRESALELQERTRKWRELLVHTHETVLNDIRSVIDSKDINFDDLKKQILAREKRTPRTQSTEVNFSDLMAEVQEYVAIQVDLNISGAGTEIPHNVYVALRSVIVEISRNFERHANATKITSKASLVYGVLRIELFHDGKDSNTKFETGIGQGIVIRETLDEINAKLFRRISGVELSVALNMRQPTSRTLGSTDLGRISVSALSIGNAVGGILYSVSLLQHAGLAEKLAGTCTVLMTVFAAFVNWKRVPVNRNYIIAISAISIVQAIASFNAISQTNSIDLLAINSVLAGFALISTIAWVDSAKLWVGALPWLVGLIAFRTQIDQETSGTAIASLNTGFGLPAFAAAAVFGIIRGNQRLKESEDLSELEIKERVAASAVADLARELDDAINDATKILLDIAKEKKVSIANRNSLRRTDSLIRAIIQVDPKTSGGFSKAALEIVRHASTVGSQIKVLMIRDRGLLLDIPEELLDDLKEVIGLARDNKSVIQVLANSDSSILILKISNSTANRVNLKKLQKHTSDAVEVRIEKAEDEKFIFVEQIRVG